MSRHLVEIDGIVFVPWRQVLLEPRELLGT